LEGHSIFFFIFPFLACSAYFENYFTDSATSSSAFLEVPVGSISTDVFLQWVNHNDTADIFEVISVTFDLLRLSFLLKCHELTIFIAKTFMEKAEVSGLWLNTEDWWRLYGILSQKDVTLEIVAILKTEVLKALNT